MSFIFVCLACTYYSNSELNRYDSYTDENLNPKACYDDNENSEPVFLGLLMLQYIAIMSPQ